MNPAAETSYHLLWKGRQSGPFSIAQIWDQLKNGEISRMHQVAFNGRWILLDEFLEKEGEGDPDARRRMEARRREEALRRQYEEELAAERADRTALEERLAETERPPPRSPLLPRRETNPAEEPPPIPAFPPAGVFPGFPERRRTNGLAIAALVMGLCNFIPYLNAVTWILALVFGHVALHQIKRDPQLDGRGLAVAGLAITYALLVAGLTFVLLMALHHRSFNL